MTKTLIVTEKMIAAQDLRKRWTGLLPSEFAKGIDDSCDCNNPDVHEDSENMMDFPRPYWLRKALEDSEGNVSIYCLDCRVDPSKDEEYEPSYIVRKEGGRKIYNFKKLIFKLSEIEEYELKHPEVKYKQISIREKDNNSEDEALNDSEESNESRLMGNDIVISVGLIAGKSPICVRDTLVKQEYARFVIAHILYNVVPDSKKNKAYVGRLMYEIDPNKDFSDPNKTSPDETTCRRLTDRLLNEAESYNIKVE